MNNLRSLSNFKGALKLVVSKKPVLFNQNSVRTAYVITEDWIPGKRPETEEEKLKAAKKYNLLPEEYVNQPDDGFSTGDYPKLDSTHHDNKDPFYPWDYPVFRMNFGETHPDDFARNTYDKGNYYTFTNEKVSILKQILYLCYFIVPTSTIIYLLRDKYKYYDPHFGQIKYDKNITRFEYPKI